MPTLVYSVEEWIQARPGGDPRARHLGGMPIGQGGQILFADGAMLVNDGSGGGPRTFDPPAERRKQLELIRRFHEGMLTVPVQQFRDRKSRMLTVGPPTDEGLADLQTLKAIIDEHRGKLRAIVQEYDALPEVVAERKEARRKRREDEFYRRRAERHQQQLREQIQQLTIDDEDLYPKGASNGANLE